MEVVAPPRHGRRVGPGVLHDGLRVEAVLHAALAGGAPRVPLQVEEAGVVPGDAAVGLVGPVLPGVAKLSWEVLALGLELVWGLCTVGLKRQLGDFFFFKI